MEARHHRSRITATAIRANAAMGPRSVRVAKAFNEIPEGEDFAKAMAEALIDGMPPETAIQVTSDALGGNGVAVDRLMNELEPLMKAHVEAYSRQLPNGRVVHVASYEAKRHEAMGHTQKALGMTQDSLTAPESPEKHAEAARAHEKARESHHSANLDAPDDCRRDHEQLIENHESMAAFHHAKAKGEVQKAEPEAVDAAQEVMKAQVKAHVRHLKSGKEVLVKSHEKKGEAKAHPEPTFWHNPHAKEIDHTLKTKPHGAEAAMKTHAAIHAGGEAVEGTRPHHEAAKLHREAAVAHEKHAQRYNPAIPHEVATHSRKLADMHEEAAKWHDEKGGEKKIPGAGGDFEEHNRKLMAHGNPAKEGAAAAKRDDEESANQDPNKGPVTVVPATEGKGHAIQKPEGTSHNADANHFSHAAISSAGRLGHGNKGQELAKEAHAATTKATGPGGTREDHAKAAKAHEAAADFNWNRHGEVEDSEDAPHGTMFQHHKAAMEVHQKAAEATGEAPERKPSAKAQSASEHAQHLSKEAEEGHIMGTSESAKKATEARRHDKAATAHDTAAAHHESEGFHTKAKLHDMARDIHSKKRNDLRDALGTKARAASVHAHAQSRTAKTEGEHRKAIEAHDDAAQAHGFHHHAMGGEGTSTEVRHHALMADAHTNAAKSGKTLADHLGEEAHRASTATHTARFDTKQQMHQEAGDLHEAASEFHRTMGNETAAQAHSAMAKHHSEESKKFH